MTLKRAFNRANLAAMAAVVVLAGCCLFGFFHLYQTAQKPLPAEPKIATNDALLKNYLKAYGANKTIAYIKTLPIDCHQRVHKVGRLNYELKGNRAFDVLNSECMSGYTHGVIEAFFHEHGTDNLAKHLELICHGRKNGFYDHQCYHGVGHGLMAYNDYDLPAALKGCDSLPSQVSHRESCYSGVFMENVVGAIAEDTAKTSQNPSQFHSSSWLSNDTLFPCNAVDPQYKGACFMFQTSRMIQIVGPDYQKVAAACEGAEETYRPSCFLSMGRDVSNTYNTSYTQIEAACKYTKVSDLSINCIEGAAQDKFWHESEQDDALGFCKTIQSPTFKNACYVTILQRGSEIIASKSDKHTFCTKFEPGYTALCRTKS